MCSPTKCRVCKKTTWSGCGQHVSAVKAMIPANQWCDGRHTADEMPKKKGWFKRN